MKQKAQQVIARTLARCQEKGLLPALTGEAVIQAPNNPLIRNPINGRSGTSATSFIMVLPFHQVDLIDINRLKVPVQSKDNR